MKLTTIRVGYFLAYKRITRSSILTNLLVIFIMVLTFLNLLFVRGILIGLPQGAINANERNYYGDIYISTLSTKKYIEKDSEVLEAISTLNNVKSYTSRYAVRSVVVGNFNERVKSDEKLDSISATALGINPSKEITTINLNAHIREGELFKSDSTNEIVLGIDLVSKFASPGSDSSATLDTVDIGDEVEITINNITKKVKVIGFANAKVGEIDSRVLMSQTLFKEFVSNEDFKPAEIVLRLEGKNEHNQTKIALLNKGVGAFAKIETPSEYQPSFVEDIVTTFAILGDVIGTIGLIVASITIFIVIFVTAVTKRKFIGILKGIGISSLAIEISYVFQSLFYATVGSAIGLIILYGFLVPYFNANPIDFPFSDGILVAEYSETINRTITLFIATIVAGYLPARYIVSQNTLDAILGR
ncbi:MAG: ABC transporter permease [Patescibacteria group bacterium]